MPLLRTEITRLGCPLLLVYIAEAHATDEWNISSARMCLAAMQWRSRSTSAADRWDPRRRHVPSLAGNAPLCWTGRRFSAAVSRMYVIAADGQLVHKTLDGFEDSEFMQCMEALKTACE